MSSANIDKNVQKLYQCVETRRIEVFSVLSPPFLRLRFNFFVIVEMVAT
jgi:hypothetical protein